MSAAKELFELQMRQQGHDDRVHRDILCLPVQARIKHMVFHFAKYTGHLIKAKQERDEKLLMSTLVDTWVIVLASSNMLNIKLSKALNIEEKDFPNLSEVGQGLAASLYPSSSDVYDLGLCELGKITGRMAKACESLDHLEKWDYRSCLEQCIIEIAKLSLAMSSLIRRDLGPLVYERWEAVERKSIFS